MTINYNLLPHAGIQSLSPYIPGKTAEEVAALHGISDIIKLASNENPLGCSEAVKKALDKLSLTELSTYPVGAKLPLRQKLAAKLGLDSEMITLVNGSDALIPLLQTCFALDLKKHVVTHDYSFLPYKIQAQNLNIPVVNTPLLPNWEIDLDALISACNEKTGLIFLASPNNPTGVLFTQNQLIKLLNSIPSTTILVVDEAYYEFVNDNEKLNTIDLLANHPNLVITRTFSKAYGLAGLRLGFAIASTEITAILQRVLLPFTVNIAAATAVSAALDDLDFIKMTVKANLLGLKQIKEGLDKLNLNYLPTSGNFITFDCKEDGMRIFQGLLQHGIIIRPLHQYEMNNFLRVTIGTEAQNTRFLEALRIIL